MVTVLLALMLLLPPIRFNGLKLQRSEVQRHAKPDPEPSSLISCTSHVGDGRRGLLIVPSRMSVLKHSRTVAEIIVGTECPFVVYKLPL